MTFNLEKKIVQTVSSITCQNVPSVSLTAWTQESFSGVLCLLLKWDFVIKCYWMCHSLYVVHVYQHHQVSLMLKFKIVYSISLWNLLFEQFYSLLHFNNKLVKNVL